MRKPCMQSFIIGFTLVMLFQGSWLIFRYNHWHWPTSYNIPGFFLLWVAQPWSLMVSSIAPVLHQLFGYPHRYMVSGILIATGLGLNCAAATFVWLTIYQRIKDRNISNIKDLCK